MKGLPVSPGIVGTAAGLAACRLANPLAAAGRGVAAQVRAAQDCKARTHSAWGRALEPLPLPASVHPAGVLEEASPEHRSSGLIGVSLGCPQFEGAQVAWGECCGVYVRGPPSGTWS